MLDISLLEKIKIIFNLILTAPYFILLLIFAVIVYFLLFQSTKQTKENKIFIYTSLYILIILAIFIKYNKELLSLLNYLIDNLFIIFYFPNFAAYVLMILTINLVLLISIFSKRMSNVIKKINIAIYCFMTYILFLNLDLISKQSLDIYLNTDLYANKEIMSLMQINNIIFLIWLVALAIYKLATALTRVELDVQRETINIPIKSPSFISRYKTSIPQNFTVKEAKPRVIYQTRIEKEPDLFTKDEYIAVLKLLKNMQNNK